MNELIRIGPSPTLAIELCGEGEFVFFLHGIGGNRQSWRAQLPAFGAHFRAAAWDARGYGDSEDFEGALAFADFSHDLRRVLDALGVERAHLVGLSMGGRIALDFFGRHPERVATLTLADTSAGHPSATDAAAIEAALRLRKQPLLDGKTPAEMAPALARAMAGPNISDEAFSHLVDALAALRPDPYMRILDGVTRYAEFPAPESIRVPTLVLNGDSDPIARPDAAQSFARRIPDHEFVLLENTGHVSNIENPARFNAVVLDFLLRRTGAARRSAAS